MIRSSKDGLPTLAVTGKSQLERARERLKVAGDDVAALRLLARALVRLGRDSSALAVYNRLGRMP